MRALPSTGSRPQIYFRSNSGSQVRQPICSFPCTQTSYSGNGSVQSEFTGSSKITQRILSARHPADFTVVISPDHFNLTDAEKGNDRKTYVQLSIKQEESNCDTECFASLNETKVGWMRWCEYSSHGCPDKRVETRPADILTGKESRQDACTHR